MRSTQTEVTNQESPSPIVLPPEMPEGETLHGGSGFFNIALQLVLSISAVAGAFAFLSYVVKHVGRQNVIDNFTHHVLWIVLLHAASAFIVGAVAHRRTLVLAAFWGLSAAILVYLGGAQVTEALLQMALVGVAAAFAGGVVFSRIPAARKKGVQLGLGICLVSIGFAYVALFHFFTRPTGIAVLSILALGVALKWLRRRSLTSHHRSAKALFGFTLSWTDIVFLECLLVVFSFVLIYSFRPDLTSDACRFYIPYLRLLNHYGGFFDLPSQWPYDIPQAAITFIGLPLVVFGTVTARFSMMLVSAAIAMLFRSRDREWAGPLAVLAISCPMMMQLASSFMLDMFTTLAILLTAYIGIESTPENSNPWIVWSTLGGLVGLAWTAKYSSLAYVGPACLVMLLKGVRVDARRHLTAALTIAPAGALLAAAPWLLHTNRETSNPFFPFLSRWFPSPGWRPGAFEFIGDLFKYPKNWKTVLIAPFEFTFHTQKYLETINGGLGAVLLILFFLALLGIVDKRDTNARLYFILALAGAIGLCFVSAYIRYWMASFFLLIPAAAQGAKRLGAMASTILVASGILVSIPILMIVSWREPEGIPWDYYRHRLSYAEYLDRSPGLNAFRYLSSIDSGYPTVLFTGVRLAGYFPVIPIETLEWEIRLLHPVDDDEGDRRWISQQHADYWIMTTGNKEDRWLRESVGSYFLQPKYKIYSDGSVEIYRLPDSVRAARIAARVRQSQ